MLDYREEFKGGLGLRLGLGLGLGLGVGLRAGAGVLDCPWGIWDRNPRESLASGKHPTSRWEPFVLGPPGNPLDMGPLGSLGAPANPYAATFQLASLQGSFYNMRASPTIHRGSSRAIRT